MLLSVPDTLIPSDVLMGQCIAFELLNSQLKILVF